MTHSCSPSRCSHDGVHTPRNWAGHWRGGDEKEKERGAEGRWVVEIQNDLGGREGTAMLGTKIGGRIFAADTTQLIACSLALAVRADLSLSKG